MKYVCVYMVSHCCWLWNGFRGYLRIELWILPLLFNIRPTANSFSIVSRRKETHFHPLSLCIFALYAMSEIETFFSFFYFLQGMWLCGKKKETRKSLAVTIKKTTIELAINLFHSIEKCLDVLKKSVAAWRKKNLLYQANIYWQWEKNPLWRFLLLLLNFLMENFLSSSCKFFYFFIWL